MAVAGDGDDDEESGEEGEKKKKSELRIFGFGSMPSCRSSLLFFGSAIRYPMR